MLRPTPLRLSAAFLLILALTSATLAGGLSSPTTASPAIGPSSEWSPPTVIDPSRGDLGAVSCASANICVAVDGSGNVLMYSGGSWSSPESIDSVGISSVSCPTTSFCAAVDGNGDLLTYDGVSWSLPESLDGVELYSISCPTSGSCVAVDGGANALFYDNGVWSSPEAIDVGGYLKSISCPTTSFCMAVDSAGNALIYDTGTWSPPESVAGRELYLDSVSCPTVSFCAVVDSSGDVTTYDGSSWSALANIDVLRLQPTNVSCASASFCTVVDAMGDVMTYDGSSWSSPDRISVGPVLQSVSCPSASFCVALSFTSLFTYNGTSWSTPDVVEPAEGFLNYISCPSPSFCAAVDAEGYAVTYDGSSWSTPEMTDEDGSLESVSCVSASFCIAVDNEGDVLTYNGTAWSPPNRVDSGTSGLESVSCVTETFCVAVGDGVVSYNGTSWSSPDTIGSAGTSLWSVSCVSESFCAAVGGDGNDGTDAFIYNGTSWSSPEIIDNGDVVVIAPVSCPTASFCAAVDGSGNVVTYNGSSWSSPENLQSGYLESISCSTASFCVAVDSIGNVVTYNGTGWSSPQNVDSNQLDSVSCPTMSFCVAVDDNGEAITYSPVVTLTQVGPTAASVANGAGYSGQLSVTDGTGMISYIETSSADSADVVVSSTGAISAASSLSPGTYTVSGTDNDTSGDTGMWNFALTVEPAVVTPPSSPPSSPPPSPPSPPVGAASSQNCSSSSSSSTCSATNAETTVDAMGEGALTVSEYSSDPVASPSFSVSGEYFDVQVASGSSFDSLTITDCNLNGATDLEWWNTAGDEGAGAWELVVPSPTYSSGPPACVSATLGSTSRPSIDELTGTIFAASSPATVPGVATNVSAKAGHCSVTLTWTAPVSDGGVAITGYAITWGNGPGLDVGDVTSATVTGLRSGTAYSFTISAINAAGSGPGSAVSNSVTPLKATSTTVLKLSKLKATYGQEQAEHASVTVSSSLPGTIATGTVTVKESATAACVIKLRLGAR